MSPSPHLMETCIRSSTQEESQITGQRGTSCFAPASTSLYNATVIAKRPHPRLDEPARSQPKPDEACPSPVVRTSQSNMDVHEALRSRVPQFRQSRQWTRFYITGDGPHSPMADPPNTSSEPQDDLLREVVAQPAIPLPPATEGRSDTESEHNFGICKPTSLWTRSALKHTRLLGRRTLPARSYRPATPKGPNRAKSTKSLRNRLQDSPKRTILPRTVQSWGNTGVSRHDQILQSPLYHKQLCETDMQATTNPSHHDSSHKPEHVTDIPSPIASLHDPKKVKRFSQSCMDMLAGGLDFGDEWRLSTFGPALSSGIEPTVDVVLDTKIESSEYVAAEPVNTASSSSPQTPRRAPNPPVRTSSKRLGTLHDRLSKRSIPEVSCEILETNEISSTLMHDADDEGDLVQPSSTHRRKHRNSPRMMPRSRSKTSQRNLKSARSIDTLSKIEAQFIHQPTNPSTADSKDKTSPNTASPGKNQTPSGQPPERPLPELPKMQQIDPQRYICEYSENQGLCTNSSVMTAINIGSNHDSKSLAEPVQPTARPINGLDEQNTGRDYHQKYLNCEVPGQGPSSVAAGLEIKRSDTRGSKSSSAQHVPTATLGIRSLTNERSSRVQEMKRRHISAWSKGGCVSLATGEQTSIRAETSSKTCGSSKNSRPIDVGTSCIATEDMQPLSADELDRFPAVPSPAGSRSRKSVNSDCSPRGRCEQKEQSGPHTISQPQGTAASKRGSKQNLRHSRIMILVDTNPHTTTFSAGAISPSSSSAQLRERCSNCIPETTKRLSGGLCASQKASTKSRRVISDNVVKEKDVLESRLSDSVQKRSNLRKLHVQADVTYSEPKHLGRRPTRRVTRPSLYLGVDPVNQLQLLLESSASEADANQVSQRSSVVHPNQSRPISRTSTRLAYREKVHPSAASVKEEVPHHDRESEILQRYERRIEYLQRHLEHTLKVWGRMSQAGKEQYLKSTFEPDKLQTRPSELPERGGNVAPSITASSVYSDKLSQARTRIHTSMEALSLLHCDTADKRRVSNSSTLKSATLSVDTTTSNTTPQNELSKRISGGSLTDPHDYELSQSPQHPRQQRRKAVDVEHAAELTTRHSPKLSERSRYLSNVPLKYKSKQATASPIVSPERCLSRRDRALIVPWEEQDRLRKGKTDGCMQESDRDDPMNASELYTDEEGNSSNDNRLSIHHAIYSTDQMDALLVM